MCRKYSNNIFKRIIKSVAVILPLIAIVVICVPNTVMALSLAVNPGRIEFNLSENNTSGMLTVINSGNKASLYKVYIVDSDYSDFFNIEPSEFMLAANSSMDVEISIKSPSDCPSNFKERICVVTMGPKSGLQIGAGIRVSIYVNN